MGPEEFGALNARRAEAAKVNMLGFQFLATVQARISGSKDANFMPEDDQPPVYLTGEEVMAKFRAIAAAQKARNG